MAAATVRPTAVVPGTAPASRTAATECKPVTKDDSYLTVSNHSVPAQPASRTISIASRAKFAPALLKQLSEQNAVVYTFDLDGDGKPDFALRAELDESTIFRTYQLRTFDNRTVEKFAFHFIQPGAWKHGYRGNYVPRTEQCAMVKHVSAQICRSE